VVSKVRMFVCLDKTRGFRQGYLARDRKGRGCVMYSMRDSRGLYVGMMRAGVELVGSTYFTTSLVVFLCRRKGSLYCTYAGVSFCLGVNWRGTLGRGRRE